jgi:hypothetical protein
MCQVVVVAIMMGNTIGLRSVMKRERRRRENEDGVRFERHGEEVRLSMSWNKVA